MNRIPRLMEREKQSTEKNKMLRERNGQESYRGPDRVWRQDSSSAWRVPLSHREVDLAKLVVERA